LTQNVGTPQDFPSVNSPQIEQEQTNEEPEIFKQMQQQNDVIGSNSSNYSPTRNLAISVGIILYFVSNDKWIKLLGALIVGNTFIF